MNDIINTHALHMVKKHSNEKPKFFIVIKHKGKKEVIENTDLGLRVVGFWAKSTDEEVKDASQIKTVWIQPHRVDHIESLLYCLKV